MTKQTNIKLIISLVLIALLLVFIIQNAAVIDLRFLFWTLSMSRSLMILFVLFIGLVVGWLVGSHFHHKSTSDAKQVKEQK